MTNQKYISGALLVTILIGAILFSGCSSNNETPVSANTNSNQEFLPVEEAFIFSANAESQNLLNVSWKIAEGYRLYKDKFKFSVSPAGYEIVEIKYPRAELFSDKNLGKLESYKGNIEISLKITGKQPDNKINLSSTYQGCADVGLCYPPETKKTEFDLASL